MKVRLEERIPGAVRAHTEIRPTASAPGITYGVSSRGDVTLRVSLASTRYSSVAGVEARRRAFPSSTSPLGSRALGLWDSTTQNKTSSATREAGLRAPENFSTPAPSRSRWVPSAGGGDPRAHRRARRGAGSGRFKHRTSPRSRLRAGQTAARLPEGSADTRRPPHAPPVRALLWCRRG